jgi:hypothetical protein
MADPYQYDPSKLYTSDGLNHQNPYNQGIGDFWGNKDKWRDMQTGQQLTPEQVAYINDINKNGVDPSRTWMDNGDPHGAESQKLYDAMKTYTYMGDDGKKYMVGGNYYRGGPVDQEAGASSKYDFMFGGAVDGAGRKPGEMAYSATAYRPDWDGDLGAYNGQGFDIFDRKGDYVGGNVPSTLGDKSWDRWQLTVLASMAAAGLGAYMAPATTGTSAVGTGATMGEGALAASGNFGVNAGTAGAAGANAAAAGGAGVGTVGATGGDGAFLGEGVQSGVGAWDGAAGGAAGGYGTVPLQGVGAPTASGYGSTGTGSMFGSGSSAGGSGGMFGGSVNIPGLGSVATSDIMKIALPLLGALGGSEGQEQTTTSTKELPEWLQGPVYGQGGLIPQSQWLMNQQLNNPGMLNQGLLRTVNKKTDKKKAKRGLL